MRKLVYAIIVSVLASILLVGCSTHTTAPSPYPNPTPTPTPKPNPFPAESKAFRNIQVTPSKWNVTVAGEGQLFEAAYLYRVKDGDTILVKGNGVSAVGNEWSKLEKSTSFSTSQVTDPSKLAFELYVASAKDGSGTSQLPVPLGRNTLGTYQNDAFRNIQVTKSTVVYNITAEAYGLFEGNYQYDVTSGGTVIAHGSGTVPNTYPNWQPFTLTLSIPTSKIPAPGEKMMLEFYQVDESGQTQDHKNSAFAELPHSFVQ